MKKDGGLWQAAGLVAGATFLSRILGLVREQVFAYLFGAGMVTDAFQIAFRIPNLLRDLFAEGAMSSALVPVYAKERLEKGEVSGWKLVNNALFWLALITISISILGIWKADWLVRVYAPAFSENPEKFELAVSLTRWMWPFFPLVVLAALSMGVLNARKVFGVPALSPTMFNVASIGAAFLICPFLPAIGISPIFGMAIGVLLGGAWQWLFQLPALFREGYRPKLECRANDPALRKIFVLMAVGTVGLAATQINILINSIFASSMGDGAVSWLGFAFRLMQFPIGVFGVAISTVTLTKVSGEVVGSDWQKVSSTVGKSLQMVLILTVPSAVGLAAFGVPIISVIYEHGRFGSLDTLATAQALAMYAVGLTAYSGVRVLVPIFYSLNKAAMPIISSIFAVVANYALCHVFSAKMGFSGLALATSCSALVNFFVLFFLLHLHLPGFSWRTLIPCFWRVSLASGIMGICLWGAMRWGADNWLQAGFFSHLSFLVIGLVLGIAVYLGCARVIGLNEVQDLISAVRQKLSARRKV